MAFSHPDVSAVWTTIELDAENTTTVIVLETGLVLGADEPGYDEAKVSALIEAVGAYASQNEHIGGVRITPSRASK
jgi:hypothetical protein